MNAQRGCVDCGRGFEKTGEVGGGGMGQEAVAGETKPGTGGGMGGGTMAAMRAGEEGAEASSGAWNLEPAGVASGERELDPPLGAKAHPAGGQVSGAGSLRRPAAGDGELDPAHSSTGDPWAVGDLEDEFCGAGLERFAEKELSAVPIEKVHLEGNGVSQGPDSEEQDEAVIEKMKDGDESALCELWRRYRGLLRNQVQRILQNPTETEDVIIEVFGEAWTRADHYHPERARPVAWLVTLARRRAIDRLRERQSYQRAGERLAQIKDHERSRIQSPVEDQMRLAELRFLIEGALGRLPEAQRNVLYMSYYEGRSQREIAESTHTPLGTVKTRLELGLRKLREGFRQSALLPEWAPRRLGAGRVRKNAVKVTGG